MDRLIRSWAFVYGGDKETLEGDSLGVLAVFLQPPCKCHPAAFSRSSLLIVLSLKGDVGEST